MKIKRWAKWAFRERGTDHFAQRLIFITPYNGVGLQSRALAGGNSTLHMDRA